MFAKFSFSLVGLQIATPMILWSDLCSPNWKSELLKMHLPAYQISPNFTPLRVGPIIRLNIWLMTWLIMHHIVLRAQSYGRTKIGTAIRLNIWLISTINNAWDCINYVINHILNLMAEPRLGNSYRSEILGQSIHTKVIIYSNLMAGPRLGNSCRSDIYGYPIHGEGNHF